MHPTFRPSYRHVFVVISAVVCVYFGVRTSSAVLADRVLALQLQNAQGVVQTMQEQNAALQSQLAYENTSAYVEKMAREQLGLMKPGDHVVEIHIGAVSTQLVLAPKPTSTIVSSVAHSPANWQRWLSLFTDPAAHDAALPHAAP